MPRDEEQTSMENLFLRVASIIMQLQSDLSSNTLTLIIFFMKDSLMETKLKGIGVLVQGPNKKSSR